MEFKGIKWVGNVYQKFEAMCLEVEEIIVQDTAKYVENQVQTVGNSVKKFYSDVVQDLLPDDESVDSGKPLPVSMLHEYAPVCSYKKKRGNMSGKNRDVKQEQEVSEGKKDGCAMKLRGLDADNYDICTSPRQYGYGGPYRRTRVGRKQILKKDGFIQVTRPCIEKDSSSAISMVHSFRVKDNVGTVSSGDSHPAEGERLIFKRIRQKDNKTEYKPMRSQDPEAETINKSVPAVVDSVKSQESRDTEIRSENEHGVKLVNSVKSQESEIETGNEQVPTVVTSVRSQDSEIQPSLATVLPAGSDDCRKETNEVLRGASSSSVSEQKLEILQQRSGRSVEDSCIFVDRDEFHCVLPDKMETDKHKPYKKIKDALSSRMKQNREKEYKRLARQWYAEDVENGRECDENPKECEENISSEESEWELL